MKAKHLLINCVLMSIISIASLYFYSRIYESKTAYIDLKKVFNNFQMKKEFEKKYQSIEKQRNIVLDSLMVELNILTKHLNEQKVKAGNVEREEIDQFEYKREKFLKLKQKFAEDNSMLSSKYDNEIVERMNQYIAEYGKNEKYDFIYGADGNGTLMYSNNKYDLSDQISQFINNKYNGIE